jgi:hypothetical protein
MKSNLFNWIIFTNGEWYACGELDTAVIRGLWWMATTVSACLCGWILIYVNTMED